MLKRLTAENSLKFEIFKITLCIMLLINCDYIGTENCEILQQQVTMARVGSAVTTILVVNSRSVGLNPRWFQNLI